MHFKRDCLPLFEWIIKIKPHPRHGDVIQVPLAGNLWFDNRCSRCCLRPIRSDRDARIAKDRREPVRKPSILSYQLLHLVIIVQF